MNKTTWESTVKPIVVLSVISLVVSLLLAVVNSMTAPVIAENERATTLAAYVDVMPSVSDASTLEEMSGYTTANVSGAVKAEDGSMAIKAGESGFDGGVLTVIMGFDAEAQGHRYLGGCFHADQRHRLQRGQGRLSGSVQRHGRYPEYRHEPGL